MELILRKNCCLEVTLLIESVRYFLHPLISIEDLTCLLLEPMVVLLQERPEFVDI